MASVLTAVICSTLIGIVFGFVPARKCFAPGPDRSVGTGLIAGADWPGSCLKRTNRKGRVMTPSLFFALNPTVGAGLPAMTAYQPTNLPPECTRSNGGSWLASDDGLQADQPPTECTHSNCGSELARESGLPDNIKTTEQTPHINLTPQPRLKYTNRYAIPATTPCAVTYAYARIRRLTRL